MQLSCLSSRTVTRSVGLSFYYVFLFVSQVSTLLYASLICMLKACSIITGCIVSITAKTNEVRYAAVFLMATGM
jgi:hypothetical protein